MNQASAEFVTGTPLAPVFSNPNYSQAAISGSTFAAAGVTPADTIAPARYPQAPTGSGVGPVIVSGAAPFNALAGIPVIANNAPLPLNTTLYNVSQRIQNMAKDS